MRRFLRFLRAMNSFFRLEMIDIFSFISCFNTFLWNCLIRPLRSWQIDYFTCGSCNASYIVKTFRHMKVRPSEHQAISTRASKHLKGTLPTSVRDHVLDCNNIVAWDDFKVLGRESNQLLLEIKESLFLKRDRPLLNKNMEL